MQKLSLFILLGAVGFFACNTDGKKTDKASGSTTDSSYTINGKIQGLDSGWIYLYNVQNEEGKPDSALIKQGNFEFKGSTAEPYFAVLTLGQFNGPRQQPLGFFVEAGKIDIKVSRDSLAKGTADGGATQAEYKKYFASYQAIEDRQKVLVEEYQTASMTGDAAKMEKAQKDFEGLEKENKDLIGKFVKENANSYVSPFLLAQNFTFEVNPAELDPLYNGLGEKTKASYFGRNIKKALDASRSTAVGSAAPDFTLNDVNGKPVSLASYKGKYVLIDFWASWCGPCRQENPNVVKAYNQYKAKGFDILGVSLDEKKDNWEKAIKQDQLTWAHVSDLGGWQSEVAGLYGVKAIPANYLLDKDGKIIAKNLRGEDLVKKLSEVLN